MPPLRRFDYTPRRTRHTFSDADSVAVYLWAVLHDRSQAWACGPENWPIHRRRRPIPRPPALSKRLRTPSVIALLQKLFAAFCAPATPGVLWPRDGKSLPVSGMSGDTQAVCGRGAGGFARGDKRHVIMTLSGDIAACQVHPMNVAERVVGQSLIETTPLQGDITADAHSDPSALHQACDQAGNRPLITPRRFARTAKGTGHRRPSRGRLRCLDLWADPGENSSPVCTKAAAKSNGISVNGSAPPEASGHCPPGSEPCPAWTAGCEPNAFSTPSDDGSD